MGIKNLSSFLTTEYKNIFETVPFSHFRNLKIAIDISLYINKYKATSGEAWRSSFLNFIYTLRKYNIHCVFIYDSGFSIEKTDEKENRKKNRIKMKEKIILLENDIDSYYKTDTPSEFLVTQYNSIMKRKYNVKYDMLFNIKVIETYLVTMKKHSYNISYEDIESTKELLDILSIPWFLAPLEAETMCADLCLEKKVDAALSDDTDLIAYGTTTFLSKISIKDETFMQLKYEDLLEELDFTDLQFLDFCIMCGTDYNKNMYGISVKTSFKLIRENKNIEALEILNYDTDILNYKSSRNLFRAYEKYDPTIKIPYCGKADKEKLLQYCKKYNISISENKIDELSFYQPIVIVD